MIHDSGREKTDRVIVFASKQQLRLLAYADKWFMNGNYNMAPRLFKLIYIIRVPIGDSAVTCVYALLTSQPHSSSQFTHTTDSCLEI